MNIMRIKKTIVYRVLAKIKNPIVRLIMNIGTVKSQLVESIYIINLQNHPERMANIIHHLKKCAIPVCRIDAVKGYEFPDNYCQLYAPNATLALTRGQVAVTLSHRKAWTQMLKTSQKIAWFFEDDARIKYFFARHLD